MFQWLPLAPMTWAIVFIAACLVFAAIYLQTARRRYREKSEELQALRKKVENARVGFDGSTESSQKPDLPLDDLGPVN